MADSGLLESLTAAHPAIGDLPALLEKLQRLDRLAIGTERAQHAAAMLQRLARDGVHLEDPAVAADWLAPVLCVSARDRRALTERLLREAGKRSNAARPTPRVIAASPLEAKAEAEVDATRRRRRIVAAVAVIVIAGLALLVALGGGGEGGAVVASPTSLASGDLDAWLQILLPVLAAAAVFVVRRLAMESPPITPAQRELPPTGQGLAWFDEGALQAPLRVMGRQRRAAGRQLDLQATIWRTVRRAGWPVVMRGGRARTPEHVLLVQLANADDPRMLAAAALLDRLRGADLRVTAFLCSDGFRTLRPWGGGAPLALARIAALHRGARLLVVSDGAALHDPLANRVAEPPEFESFALKALITPTARAAWSWREAALDRAGWRLTELSTDGVTELARWLSGPREALPMLDAAASTGTSFIDLLTRDARLFRDDGALPAELRGRLLDRIATHLDPDPHLPPAAFDLLRVLAMGTELTPAAIERVAAHLSSLDGPRADEAGLRRLLALPWFTRGGLPIWLREDLLQALPAELAATGRDAWRLHLSGQPIGKGALTAEQSARIAAQSRLVLMQSFPADDVMRRVLELEPVAANWRSRLSEGAIAALLASGAGFGLWAIAQLGTRLAQFATMLFAPLAFLIDATRPWLGLAAVLLAAGVFLPLERLSPSLRRALIVAIGAAALLLAIGPVVLPAKASFPAEDGYGGALVAVIGMLALRALLPWPVSPIVTARALFVPGHPWWNAVPILGIATMTYAMMDATASPGGIPRWAMRELLCALGAAAIGAAIFARLRGVATIEARIGSRSAIAFVAGQATAGGIATLLLGLAVAPRPEIPASLLLLARVAGGVACVAASLGTPIDARRLVALFAISIALPAFMFVLANAGYFGIDETYLGMQVIAAVLAMPMLWAWIAWPPPASTRRWGVLIVFGVLYLAGFVALILSLDSGSPVVAAIVALPYLLVWPLLRASRTDLVTRGDGLWWRCLALAPCWIGISVPTFGGGPFPLLAIPLAAWIAQRHGTRALPAIALALVPMAFGFDGSGVRLGGSLGHAFTALLVARFVADGEFRAACLAATRVAPWQLAALAILPLGYNSPRAFGFQIVIGAWPLVIALCVLIGLSRAPLRQPLLVLTGSSIAAFALTLIFGPYLSDDFGRLSHGLRNVPGDIITIMLALGLFRMLRGGAPLEPARALLVLLRDQPGTAGAVIACVGYLLSVSLVVRFGAPSAGESLSLVPFFGAHFLLATLFWAASGIAPARRPEIAIRGRDVPWTVILASLVLMIDLLPSVSIDLGGVSVSVFGRNPLHALGVAATVWAFHRLGQALARYPGVVAR